MTHCAAAKQTPKLVLMTHSDERTKGHVRLHVFLVRRRNYIMLTILTHSVCHSFDDFIYLNMRFSTGVPFLWIFNQTQRYPSHGIL